MSSSPGIYNLFLSMDGYMQMRLVDVARMLNNAEAAENPPEALAPRRYFSRERLETAIDAADMLRKHAVQWRGGSGEIEIP